MILVVVVVVVEMKMVIFLNNDRKYHQRIDIYHSIDYYRSQNKHYLSWRNDVTNNNSTVPVIYIISLLKSIKLDPIQAIFLSRGSAHCYNCYYFGCRYYCYCCYCYCYCCRCWCYYYYYWLCYEQRQTKFNK